MRPYLCDEQQLHRSGGGDACLTTKDDIMERTDQSTEGQIFSDPDDRSGNESGDDVDGEF